MIELVGEDFVNVSETGPALILHLQVTGYSFGVIPLQILPLGYSQFEENRNLFGIKFSLSEIAGSELLPDAVPCELKTVQSGWTKPNAIHLQIWTSTPPP